MRQRFAPATVLATVALAVALMGVVIVLFVAGVEAEQDLTPAKPVAKAKPVARSKPVARAKPVAKPSLWLRRSRPSATSSP